MSDRGMCPRCMVELDFDGVCPSCGASYADSPEDGGVEGGVRPMPPGPHTVMAERHLPRTDAPDIEQAHRLPVHTVLNGRYLVERVLGEGGFGITYEGFDQVLEKRIAIKEYFPSGHATRNCTRSLQVTDMAAADGSYLRGKERFIEEARSMAKVGTQEALVGVSDFFEEFGTAYIIMDYVEGKSLKEVLADRGGRIPFGELMEMLMPIMGALGAMHEAGLVHRDISPDNIMVGPHGATLIDFGCAREFISDDGSVQMMTVMLKYDYAAPEQYTRTGQGPWTDVYGMCAVIYFAITGELVPRAPDRYNGEEVKLPSRFGVAIPKASERALMRGLSLKGADRYQTMGELARALNDTSSPRRPAPMAIATAVVGVISCVVAAVLLLGGVARPAPQEQATPTQEASKAEVAPEEEAPEEETSEPLEQEARLTWDGQDMSQDTDDSEGASGEAASAEGGRRGGEAGMSGTPNAPRQKAFYKRDRAFCAGGSHTLAIDADGGVRATGSDEYGQCKTGEIEDAVAVAAGAFHSVVLRADGTVVACGDDTYWQCEVDGWTDIEAVAAGMGHTLALGTDGIVRATGSNEFGQRQVGMWRKVKAIDAGVNHSLALLSDGTCVACGLNEPDGRCEVDKWTGVTQIAAGGLHSCALLSDGTVVCVGNNDCGQCETDDWSDVVAISAGLGHTVGLRSDGTCVACGMGESGQLEVESWKDVVAISCGDYHTVGLLSDGSLVACGLNDGGQCDLGGWVVADELDK